MAADRRSCIGFSESLISDRFTSDGLKRLSKCGTDFAVCRGLE